MALFSDERERRGLLLFVPLMLLIAVGALLVDTRRMKYEVRRSEAEENPLPADSVQRFAFDPNTIGFDSLLLLGFSRSQTIQLLKYRQAGKIFRLPEELSTLYGMSDSLFRSLRPLVVIGEKFRFHPRPEFDRAEPTWSEHPWPKPPRRTFRATEPFRIDTVSVDYLRSLGFTTRWSEAFVDCYRRREMRSLNELRDIAFIGDSIADLLAPWLLFPERKPSPFDEPVELNRADTTELCRVYGIGPRSARAIVTYRERLGGFYCVEQLTEVRGVTEANYERIVKQISCDSFLIRKININFAPLERLRIHPYMPPRLLRKLLNKRQQRKSKGGWSTVEEMVDDNILTEEEARRLRPYLQFGTQQNE